MKSIRWSRLACLAVCAVAFVLPSAAQTKVGIVNLQKALQDTAEIKAAEAALKAKYGPQQEALAKLEREVAQLQQEGQANQEKYTEAALAELGNKITIKQRQLQRNGEGLQSAVDRERQDILRRVGQRFQEVVKKVAEEKGFDCIIDTANLLYSKAGLDISVEVTAAYDKAYPAK
jgi:outer membrane protein